MDPIVELSEWRDRREPSLARLERAVDRLDEALSGMARAEAPPWLVTEVFAIQGCISMELAEEATERTERLLVRWRRYERRKRRG